MNIKSISKSGILLSGLFFMATANAGSVVQCGEAVCSASFTVAADGNNLGGGEFNYDAETGDISLSTKNVVGGSVGNNGGITWDAGNGKTMTVGSISGNADPVLGFGVAASTGEFGGTFSFTFDLPIAIAGAIETKSETSYSLTSKTDAGAQIQALGAGDKVVRSWDVDTSVGGLAPLNKKVDVGDTYFHLGGPSTSASSVYSDTDSIVGDLAYDLMSVQVAFILSPESNVGISGFVSQTPVPVPGAAWLMLTGLGFLASRRKPALVA